MANAERTSIEDRLDRIERILEASLRSNEEFRRSNEEFRRSNEEFRRSTEESIRSTEEFKSSTEAFIRSTEEFIRSTEEFKSSTEEFIRSTEDFIRSTEAFKRSTEAFIAESRQQAARFGELLGHIGNTIGMTIESQGYHLVSRYLKEREGLSVRFQHRKLFRLNGALREVDLLGEAWKNGHKLTFLCECKARADRGDVEALAQTATLIKPKLRGTIRPILFTYEVRKGARTAASRLGVTLVTPFDVSP